MCRIIGDMIDFYSIETASSMSKDSSSEEYHSSNKILCSTSTNNNSILIKDHQFDSSLYDDMHTPLRRTLGNTKLKTRQDVRRFRKFLKRHYDVSSIALIDIDPDSMRRYLIDYLTSIRTRKGAKYDPETLRSYYLSIQRFLKDSNYPFCLRNSPQFAQCRDLIIQMRKEKNLNKTNDFSLSESIEMKTNRYIINKKSIPIEQQQQASSSEMLIPPCVSTKDLLPSSSLPPRKRQQMKYFLEFGSPNDFLLPPPPPPSSISRSTCPSDILSSNAYYLLVRLTQQSSHCSSQQLTNSIEHDLDQSTNCGNLQRLMLTRLCQEWTGDIRLIHSNLRTELRSYLPHILVLNILSSKCSPVGASRFAFK